ncbi:SLAM family member 5-like isoform X2 [Brienomyrus brachyistius]|uniref:SLAM family member 5-like isoform X2 n=1 Tax=Brienomyrus brachyistius TaxID=42636 RepID=UPI0020B1BC71|nr:SLAM family member 5-like isoform X2 [Brienomyrus brachyistius]
MHLRRARWLKCQHHILSKHLAAANRRPKTQREQDHSNGGSNLARKWPFCKMSTSLVHCFLRLSLLMWTLSVVFLKLPIGQCWRVVNGAVGESAVLSGTNDTTPATNLQWRKDKVIMQRLKGNITFYNQAYEGRLTLSEKHGSLTINPLIKSDTGKYTFESLPPPWPTEMHVLQLNVYDRIVSVEMDSQVSYSPENSTCTVTLSCTVKGSVVKLSWSKDRKKIPDTEGNETLVVTPTAGEELYSCTASNPVSSQTASLGVSSCQTHVPLDISIYALAGIGALFVLILAIIGCIFQVRAKREVTKENTVYAEANKPHVRERSTQDICSRQASPSEDVSTCYEGVRSTSDICSRQDSPPGDVSTCYEALRGTSDMRSRQASPSEDVSTCYEGVRSTSDICSRQDSPPGDVSTCYEALRGTSDMRSRQASPSEDVSTCYEGVRSTSDICSRQDSPPGDVSTCYEALRGTSDMRSRQASPSEDVSTCYEGVRSTSDICSRQDSPPGDVSTCYEALRGTSVVPSGN